jgi:hypothetical protein
VTLVVRLALSVYLLRDLSFAIYHGTLLKSNQKEYHSLHSAQPTVTSIQSTEFQRLGMEATHIYVRSFCYQNLETILPQDDRMQRLQLHPNVRIAYRLVEIARLTAYDQNFAESSFVTVKPWAVSVNELGNDATAPQLTKIA